jgi:two-component system, NarL family, invasion response regulator UvrY
VIRILVADDHGILRRGIAQIVSESEDIVVAGEASSGEEALSLAAEGGYEVVLLDISMPGRGGLDVIRDIKAACPGVKVIVLSMHPEEQFAVRSLREGASAYLVKSRADEELLPAIRAVAAGRRYITPEVAERLARFVERDSGASANSPHELLSKREYQILVLLGSGFRVTDIARDMNLSVKTVSTYRARMLTKMGFETNAQLVKYVSDHGLST